MNSDNNGGYRLHITFLDLDRAEQYITCYGKLTRSEALRDLERRGVAYWAREAAGTTRFSYSQAQWHIILVTWRYHVQSSIHSANEVAA